MLAGPFRMITTSLVEVIFISVNGRLGVLGEEPRAIDHKVVSLRLLTHHSPFLVRCRVHFSTHFPTGFVHEVLVAQQSIR